MTIDDHALAPRTGSGHAGSEWEAVYGGAVPDTPVDADVVAVTRELQPGTALDLGCGTGQNSIWLAQQGWRVRGIDIAGGAIEGAEEAARVAGVEAAFERGDVTDWRTAERYDFVISTYAMPPRGPGRVRALTTARGAVAPGGTVLITEFEISLAESGWMAAEHLVTLDEVVELLPGFELGRAEVRVTAHGHGGETRQLPVVIVVAHHPESPREAP